MSPGCDFLDFLCFGMIFQIGYSNSSTSANDSEMFVSFNKFILVNCSNMYGNLCEKYNKMHSLKKNLFLNTPPEVASIRELPVKAPSLDPLV